jgi:membrane-associated protease RseP (regulator of RpoE activity)
MLSTPIFCAAKPALMVALVFGSGAIAQADKTDGPVIQIGRSDPDSATPKLPPPGDGSEPGDQQLADEPAAPQYWIGIVGGPIGPDHLLRAHIDLPENQGLLVVNVVPDSPAAKAGVKTNDILLRANDADLHEMHDLVDLVVAEGGKQGQIAVDILRRGQHETVHITPQERPAGAAQSHGHFGQAFGPGFRMPGGVELPQELLEQFSGSPMQLRSFGPGVIVGGGLADIPNGVSVNIKKQDGQPAEVTVQRGKETWRVTENDPESLSQLPDDLRPFVEQTLRGRSLDLNLGGADKMMPELGDGRLRERLERMEERMQELHERMMQRNAPADDASHSENDTAAEQ